MDKEILEALDEKSIQDLKEIAEFVKKAFCIDGETSVIGVKRTIIERQFQRNITVKCNDKKRGIFYVSISKPY